MSSFNLNEFEKGALTSLGAKSSSSSYNDRDSRPEFCSFYSTAASFIIATFSPLPFYSFFLEFRLLKTGALMKCFFCHFFLSRCRRCLQFHLQSHNDYAILPRIFPGKWYMCSVLHLKINTAVLLHISYILYLDSPCCEYLVGATPCKNLTEVISGDNDKRM